MVVSKDPMMSGGYNNESSPVLRKIKSNKLPVAIALVVVVCVLAKLLWPSQVGICIYFIIMLLIYLITRLLSTSLRGGSKGPYNHERLVCCSHTKRRWPEALGPPARPLVHGF